MIFLSCLWLLRSICFETQANPIHLDHTQVNYPISNGYLNRDVYSIESVEGVDKNGRGSRIYHSYFQTKPERGCCYQYNRGYDYRGNFTGNITLSLPEDTNNIQEEYLSISLKASDGNLPRAELAAGDVSTQSSDIPKFIAFSNISRPSATVYPPKTKNYPWYVINHLNLNVRSLTDKESLQKLLIIYNWGEDKFAQKLIKGIVGVSSSLDTYSYRDGVLKGTLLKCYLSR